MGFWNSSWLDESSECSMRTGPKQMARFCGVILFLSDCAVTRHRWSMSRNSVVCNSKTAW